MNIFYLDHDPYTAVTYLMDIHVRKMTLETCQLLMTTDVLHGYARPYRPTHINHPCRLSLEDTINYNWLCVYFGYICKEYSYRFGHRHSCEEYYVKYYSDQVLLCVPNFPQCMPMCFKRFNTVDAYRKYYRHKYQEFFSRNMANYTKRETPSWMYN